MTTSEPFDDLVITFKPDATPEAEERFLAELAVALLAIARHVIETEGAAKPKEGDGPDAEH